MAVAQNDIRNLRETFDYTPAKVGVIDYVCTIHSGQRGQIRVMK